MSKKSKPGLMALLVLVSILGACDGGLGFGVRGSGDMVTEDREVSDFDSVDLRGQGTVTIDVTGTETLSVEAEDNIIGYLTTDVASGTLRLGSSRTISPTEEIVYTITAARIEGLEVSGSGSITATDVAGDQLDLSVSGSGEIELPDIELASVVVDISGSGAVTVSGMTNDLDVDISGSGDFDGEDLVSETAAVTVAGSGHALMNATDQLRADISGSGHVEYVGDPVVEAETSGSGSISGR